MESEDKILSESKFIKLLHFKKNKGKGAAIRFGLKESINPMIVIYDGDLELNPLEIQKLMILNNNIKCVFGNRYYMIRNTHLIWDIGNKIFTKIFNLIYRSSLKDVLCCAKAFFKSDLNIERLIAKKFDIDIEIASHLIKKHNNVSNIDINYNRRSRNDGKKLKFIDGFLILYRMIKSYWTILYKKVLVT